MLTHMKVGHHIDFFPLAPPTLSLDPLCTEAALARLLPTSSPSPRTPLAMGVAEEAQSLAGVSAADRAGLVELDGESFINAQQRGVLIMPAIASLPGPAKCKTVSESPPSSR